MPSKLHRAGKLDGAEMETETEIERERERWYHSEPSEREREIERERETKSQREREREEINEVETSQTNSLHRPTWLGSAGRSAGSSIPDSSRTTSHTAPFSSRDVGYDDI